MKGLARDIAKEILASECNVHLSVDLGFFVRQRFVPANEVNNFARVLIDAVVSQLRPNLGLMVATFNFDFGATRLFDVVASPPHTGRFAELALSCPAGRRTETPFYSFVMFGNHQNALHPYPYKRNTGESSPFEFQVDNQYQLVAVGHHINKALTLTHHSENLASVPWRYEKRFKGYIRGQNGDVSPAETVFFVRGPGVEHSAMTVFADKRLRRSGLIESAVFRSGEVSIPIERLNIPEVHEVFSRSLEQGQSELVAPIVDGINSDAAITPQIADQLFAARYCLR